jgi:hypothetical protein
MPKSALTNLMEDLVKSLGLNMEIEDSTSYTLSLGRRSVELEMDDEGKFVIVSAILGKIPPGKYRQDVLEQALKSNGYPPPVFGYLGFDKDTEMLVLHKQFHISKVSKDELLEKLPGLVEMAKNWDQAISSSTVPIASKPDPSQAPNILEILEIKT